MRVALRERANDRADAVRLREGALGPRARRPRPGRGHRRAAVLGRPDRAPHAATAARSAASRSSARPHRGARAHRTARRRWSARRSRRARAGGRSTAPAACSRPPSATTGCGCSRRSSARPRRRGPRAAALTPFLGWSAERIATAAETEWEEVHRRLHHWAGSCASSGVAALTETIMVGEQLPARVLAGSGGERRLTDLRHLAQLLHAAASAERLGATALRGWLAQRIAAAEREEGRGGAHAPARVRRRGGAGADDPSQQGPRVPGRLLPVPVGARLRSPTIPSRCSSTIPAAGDRRTIDVGLDGRGFHAHARQHRLEQRGEELRLAYVALTRAKHQAVIWWAGSFDSRDSPLGRLLFAKDADGNVAPRDRLHPQATQTPWRALRSSRRRRRVRSASSALDSGSRPPGARRLEPAAELVAAQLRPTPRPAVAAHLLQRHHRRGARSARRQRAGGGASSATSLRCRRRSPTPVPRSRPRRSCERYSLFADAPVGTAFGTFVHRVLQASDFAAADLEAELAARIAAAAVRRKLDAGDPGGVVAGTAGGDQTPLGLDRGRHPPCRCAVGRPARRARVRTAPRRGRRPQRAPDADRDRRRAARPSPGCRTRWPAMPHVSRTRRCARACAGF